MYNSYNCNYFYKNKKTKEYFRNGNNACWKGLDLSVYNLYLKDDEFIYYNSKRDLSKVKSFIEKDFNFNIIYIKLPKQHYYKDLTEILYNKYITRIVNLINKITPCKKVIINDVLHIKYTLLNNYYQDLLLLNIIRMLWYKPTNININKYIENILKPKEKNKDVLYFILEVITNAIEEEEGKSYLYGGHSCVYKDIKLKTSKQLLEYKGNSMQIFLTM